MIRGAQRRPTPSGRAAKGTWWKWIGEREGSTRHGADLTFVDSIGLVFNPGWRRKEGEMGLGMEVK